MQVYSGATLEINGTGGSVSLTNSLNIGGSGTILLSAFGANNPSGSNATPEGAIQSFNGSNTLSGMITLSSPSTITSTGAGNTLSISGGISSSGFGLTIAGGGIT